MVSTKTPAVLVVMSFKSGSELYLMNAVEFDSYETNKQIIDGCIADGVITDWFLHCSNSMRIAPPLVITEKEIEEACQIILKNIKLVCD